MKKTKLLSTLLVSGAVLATLVVVKPTFTYANTADQQTNSSQVVNTLLKTNASNGNNKTTVTDLAPESSQDVSTYDQLKDALKDKSVTSINITADITFTGSITAIPQRNITIDGQNHTLIMHGHDMVGHDGHTLAVFNIKNATITNLDNAGVEVSRVFHAPNAEWSVSASNINYKGLRLFDVPHSTIQFSGNNTITTKAENAICHGVNFVSQENEGTYNGTVTGPYSGFHFSTTPDDGTVVVNPGATANITLEEDNYPAFYNHVSTIRVTSGGSLHVVAAGPTVHAPALAYKVTPNLTVDKGGNLYLESKGESNNATIETNEKSFEINLNGNYDIRNTGNHKLFDSNRAILNISNVLKTWDIGTDIEGTPTQNWKNVNMVATIDDNSSTVNSTDIPEIYGSFQTERYQRISGKEDSPTLNPITDQDKLITGTGIPGDTVIITVDGEQLGQATVGKDGKWTYTLTSPLKEGQVVQAKQTDNATSSDPVEQTVTHSVP